VRAFGDDRLPCLEAGLDGYKTGNAPAELDTTFLFAGQSSRPFYR
jgi:hypothetical protein